jgi:hypothetical protein
MEVMGDFHEREAERERKKQEELAPYIEQAMKRKQWLKELSDEQIPVMHALGRQIVEQSLGDLQKAGPSGGLSIPLEDPAAKV